jgi:predicted amidohydrolase
VGIERIGSGAKFIADPAHPANLAPLKFGLLQLNSTIGDYDANRAKLVAGYEQACRAGAEFVIAPELFLCGYPPRDLLLREDFVEFAGVG